MLTVLSRANDLDLDARPAQTMAQVRQISRWRSRETDSVGVAVIRSQAKDMTEQAPLEYQRLASIYAQLQLVEDLCAGLLDIFGVGPVSAAAILCAHSH